MNDASAQRPKLLMLVPHEPTLDPRVHYTATSLAKRYDVTVVAVLRDFEWRPEENFPQRPTYATERVPLGTRGVAGAIADFCGLFVESKRGRRNRVLSAFLAGGLFLAGVIAASVMLALELVATVIVAAALPIVQALRLLRPGLVVIPALVRAVRRVGRFRATTAWAARLIAAGRGLHATLAIFRFTFQANATLLRHIRHRGLAANHVYCHDLYSLQTAVMLKRATGCRVIYDSHEYFPYQFPSRLYRTLTRLYERVLVGFVKAYITVSPPLARELEKLYDRDDIVAIPNVEPLPDDRPAPAAGEMSALAAGRMKLLYQGNFAEGRGLEEVLQEWPQVDGTRAALFLRGPANRWRDRLEAIARERRLLGKSVFFLPPVLERDLIAAAREADLGLIPYKVESEAYRFACPNKLSQYLHAGLGIVANSIPFVRAMVDEQGIGVCYDIGEAGGFAHAINRIAADPAELARVRGRATATARDVYCWERYESTLLAAVEAA